ncbi:MAG: ABC transporter ATP-binding protein, partial [Gammaproteobacteria bacterium]
MERTVSENTAPNNSGMMLLVNNIEVIYDHVILVL